MLVYAIKHKLSGRIYIGCTTQSLRSRWNKHCVRARTGTHPKIPIGAAIAQYGPEAFDLYVIARFNSLEEALNAERFFIETHRRSGENLYNLTDGGKGSLGYKHRPESIAKSRKRALVRNMKLTSARRTPCTIDGIQYVSRVAAAESLGVARNTITRWLRTGVRGGGRWPKKELAIP